MVFKQKSFRYTPIWLKTFHKSVHRYFDHVFTAGTLRSSLSIFYPSRCCKIGGFRTIESMIKTSMITIWKCNHYFPSFLGYL